MCVCVCVCVCMYVCVLCDICHTWQSYNTQIVSKKKNKKKTKKKTKKIKNTHKKKAPSAFPTTMNPTMTPTMSPIVGGGGTVTGSSSSNDFSIVKVLSDAITGSDPLSMAIVLLILCAIIMTIAGVIWEVRTGHDVLRRFAALQFGLFLFLFLFCFCFARGV